MMQRILSTWEDGPCSLSCHGLLDPVLEAFEAFEMVDMVADGSGEQQLIGYTRCKT